jgi:hypothetical protein
MGYAQPAFLIQSIEDGGLGCSYIPMNVRLEPGDSTPTQYNYSNPLDPIYLEYLTTVYTQFKAWLVKNNLLSRVKNLRLDPCSSGDAEVCFNSIGYVGTQNLDDPIRYDAQWAAAPVVPWTPNAANAFCTAFSAMMANLFPGVTFSFPLLDPMTQWPRVNNQGGFTNPDGTPITDTTAFVLSFFAAAQAGVAGTSCAIAAFQTTMSAEPNSTIWYAKVAMGGIPQGQTNIHGKDPAGMEAYNNTPPTSKTAEEVITSQLAQGTVRLELHLPDVTVPDYAAAYLQYGIVVI